MICLLLFKGRNEFILQKEQNVLFVHIREIEEIKVFRICFETKGVLCKTLLVTRKQEQK